MCQAGVAVTLPYLADLTERWLSSGEDHTSPLWREAHELSGHMISSWHGQERYPSREKAPTHATQMLLLLIQLADRTRLKAFLATIAAGNGSYSEGDNDAIVQALGLLSSRRAAALTQQIIAGNAATSLTACGNCSPGWQPQGSTAGRPISEGPRRPWSKPCQAIRSTHRLGAMVAGSERETSLRH